MDFRIKFSILLIFTSFIAVKSTKLNYPRVLLPIFDDLRINFTLQVLEKGCFSWTSSRSDLIQIKPLYDDNDCSSEAIVTSITKTRARNTAIVLAEDLSSGEILRCDVILDLIDKLGVLTTTRELYLEEAPETFELILFDSQGNAFTTLDGIEFQWKIGLQHNTASTESSWNQVLRFLDFSASKYHEIPKDIEKLEVLGLKGYKVLLEGINTGYAKVTVRLPHQEYKSVSQVEVDIMVLANLIIDPIDVHILVGDTVNFRILQLKQGKLQEITTTNQYYLEIENTQYAKLSGNTATGLEIGRTSVVLRDKNVPHYDKDVDNSPNKPPTPRATLTVTNPAKIALDLLPYHNWITVEGHTHDIAIDLYTIDNHKIKLGSKYKLTSKFDTTLFNEHKRNSNGSRIRGEAAFEGTNPVSAAFKELSANAEMLIYSRINLVPKLVVLPYDPTKPIRQKVQFKATGGDKNYNWYSSNTNLLQITQQGLAESKLDRLKESQAFENCTVKVALTRNPKIFETSKVLFLPPIKLEIVGYNFETAVGDYINAFVALYAFHNDTYLPLTSCENLPFELEFSDQRIFTVERHDSEDKVRDSCRLIKLKGNHAGSTNFKVTYSFGDRVLKDEVILNAFDPLTIFNPESNQIVLPIGSQRNVFYQNGPQKVFNVAAELTKNVNHDKKLTDVTEIKSDFSSSRLIFNVLCKKIGETELNLEVYNILNKKNFIKYTSVFTTKIYCVKPRFVNLYTNDKLKTSCPIESKNSLMIVNSGKDSLDIEIEVLDSENRKLDNISSLVIDWQFSQANGLLSHNIAYNQEVETDEIDGVPIPKRDFLKTSIPDNNINHKIKAIVKQYNLAILSRQSISPESPHFGIQKISGGPIETPTIENELNFLSFDSALLPINSVSIFLAPNVKETIKTGHGSGYYDIKVVDPMILDVEFNKQSSELILRPKNIGNTKVRILDRCLKTDATILDVSVVSIGRIELSTPDRVERLKSIEAIVRLYDSNNNLLDVDLSNLEIYELNEEIKNVRILKMKQDHQLSLNRGEIRYKITGTELGETKIVVSSGSGNRLISSTPATVQVFPPLILIPRNATILVGSTLEVSSRGGPKPEVNIEYQVLNGDILGIDGSVVEGLKVGKTKVVGRCVGRSPSSDTQIVFSEDVIYITVINLHGIKIKNPLNRLKAETVMPASVWGEPDISPLILGTLRNLKIQWTTTAPDIIEIKGRFDDLGVVYQDKDLISVRVRGLKPGKGKLMASLTLGSQKFNAQTEVIVFKTLELESPKRIAYDPILVPPKTSLQLKANLDDVIYELNDQLDINIINVSRDGIVKSSDTLGRSLVIASSLDQKLSIPIEVKNIHYILTTVITGGVSMKRTEFELPQNLNFGLKVTLHDNLGNEFSHDFDDLNSLKHKLAKSSDVYVHLADNFTLAVDLLRESSNVLEVSLKDGSGVKYSQDFMKLEVKKIDSVFNMNSLFVVGDVICFDSPLSEALIWRSNNENIVKIDENTGIARVLKPSSGQKVIVSHGKSDGVFVDFEMDVKEADKVEFMKSFDNFNGEEYLGHFVISNHLLSSKRLNLIANNRSLCNRLDYKSDISFVSCKLSNRDNGNGLVVSEKFATRPVFDKKTGFYACGINVLTNIDDITNISKNKNFNLDLEVRLSSGISDTMILKLIPAVKINPKSIYVDNVGNQEIVVSGMDNILQKVEVSSSNPEHLALIQLPKTQGQLQYRTKLLQTHDGSQDLFVKIESPMTHQNVQIPILTQAPDPQCSYSYKVPTDFATVLFEMAENLGKLIATVVVGGVIVFILIKLYPRDRFDQNNSVFQTSKNASSNNASFGLNTTPPSPIFQASPLSSQQNPSLIYKTSPYQPGNLSGSSNLSSYASSVPDSPIYGDTTIHSPQKRINRRNL